MMDATVWFDSGGPGIVVGIHGQRISVLWPTGKVTVHSIKAIHHMEPFNG